MVRIMLLVPPEHAGLAVPGQCTVQEKVYRPVRDLLHVPEEARTEAEHFGESQRLGEAV